MRSIKFRAWDKKEQKWWHNVWVAEGYVWVAIEGDGETATIVPRKDLIPVEFTGLKDKNSEEIYEGDVIRIISTYETDEPINCKAKVSFKDGAFETDFHGSLIRIALKGNWEVEIIGNIYENKELLNA